MLELAARRRRDRAAARRGRRRTPPFPGSASRTHVRGVGQCALEVVPRVAVADAAASLSMKTNAAGGSLLQAREQVVLVRRRGSRECARLAPSFGCDAARSTSEPGERRVGVRDRTRRCTASRSSAPRGRARTGPCRRVCTRVGRLGVLAQVARRPGASPTGRSRGRESRRGSRATRAPRRRRLCRGSRASRCAATAASSQRRRAAASERRRGERRRSASTRPARARGDALPQPHDEEQPLQVEARGHRVEVVRKALAPARRREPSAARAGRARRRARGAASARRR